MIIRARLPRLQPGTEPFYRERKTKMDHMTARISCFARAWHFKNSCLPVFEDSAAEKLLGEDYITAEQSMMQGVNFFFPDHHGTPEEGLRLIVDRQLSPSVLGRSAYCEKKLENEIRLGCRQYLICAAGYDTYAIRNASAPLAVFDLDLPEMIADKQERVAKAGLPSCARYIACDLSREEQKEALAKAGFDARLKSFASLLGICHYLTKSSFSALLESLKELLSEGFALCLDYPTTQNSKENMKNRMLAQAAGEPVQAVYSVEEMEALLSRHGFLVYEALDHDEMTAQYFSNHNAAEPEHPLSAPEGVAYLLAVRK